MEFPTFLRKPTLVHGIDINGDHLRGAQSGYGTDGSYPGTEVTCRKCMEKLVKKEPKKCIGLMGRIFGHRFTVTVGDSEYKTDYCGRCGAKHE